MNKRNLLRPSKYLSYLVRRTLGTITHVRTREPAVALTFDDGPHPTFTPRLLDILDRHGAGATFFMVGQAAARYPDLVRRIAQGGHAIGNHSWDHSSFALLRSTERRAQIHACARALAPYGQRLFRPPNGHQTLGSHLDILSRGYQIVTWNISGRDWLAHSAHEICARVMADLKPGSIVLLHDSLFHYLEERYLDRSPTLEAVDMLLGRMRGELRFVTVPELLRLGQPQRANWYVGADLTWIATLKRKAFHDSA